MIPGPDGSAWEGGRYKAKLIFPKEYPTEPPTAKFTPPIFHPNVYTSGEVCLTILHSHSWFGGTSVADIVMALQRFLIEPNADDPANTDAGLMIKGSRKEYEDKVRKYALTVTP